MSRFFIGQRVKLVRGLDLVSPAKSYGEQGVVIAFDFYPAGTSCADGSFTEIDCDCAVQWDSDGSKRIQHTAQLEPILPEGHQPSECSLEELLESLSEVEA